MTDKTEELLSGRARVTPPIGVYEKALALVKSLQELESDGFVSVWVHGEDMVVIDWHPGESRIVLKKEDYGDWDLHTGEPTEQYPVEGER